MSTGFRDPGGIRTHDPQLRRLLLYPTELRDQHKCACKGSVLKNKTQDFKSF